MFAGRPAVDRRLIHCPLVILYVWLTSLKLFTGNKCDELFSKLSKRGTECICSSGTMFLCV